MSRLVALTGAAGCGKTTIGRALIDAWSINGDCVSPLSFAMPLRDMVASLLRCVPDLGDEDIQHLLYTQEGKATPVAALGGKTPRQILQTLGTEWGRAHLGSAVWSDLGVAWALRLLRDGVDAVIFDDARFAEEALAIRAAGGVTVRLVRPGADPVATHGHASEAGIPADLIDLDVINVGPADAVAAKITRKINDLYTSRAAANA